MCPAVCFWLLISVATSIETWTAVHSRAAGRAAECEEFMCRSRGDR